MKNKQTRRLFEPPRETAVGSLMSVWTGPVGGVPLTEGAVARNVSTGYMLHASLPELVLLESILPPLRTKFQMKEALMKGASVQSLLLKLSLLPSK